LAAVRRRESAPLRPSSASSRYDRRERSSSRCGAAVSTMRPARARRSSRPHLGARRAHAVRNVAPSLDRLRRPHPAGRAPCADRHERQIDQPRMDRTQIAMCRERWTARLRARLHSARPGSGGGVASHSWRQVRHARLITVPLAQRYTRVLNDPQRGHGAVCTSRGSRSGSVIRRGNRIRLMARAAPT